MRVPVVADVEADFLVGEVDCDAVEQPEHVHADQHGWHIVELEQVERVRVREDDRHVAEPQVPDPDLGHQPYLAGDRLAGDADQFAQLPDRLVAEQGLAQRGVADRIFGARVDDRDDLVTGDGGVGDDQLAEAAARGHDDGRSILSRSPAARPGERDAVALEIELHIAVLQHVGAEKAGRAERRRRKHRGVNRILVGAAHRHMVKADRVDLVGADQPFDRDSPRCGYAELGCEPIRNDAAVRAGIDREGEGALAIDRGEDGHAAGRIGRRGEGFPHQGIEFPAGPDHAFRRGQIVPDEGQKSDDGKSGHDDLPLLGEDAASAPCRQGPWP